MVITKFNFKFRYQTANTKIANMSSVVLETWTQVKTTKKRSGKKKEVTGALGAQVQHTAE